MPKLLKVVQFLRFSQKHVHTHHVLTVTQRNLIGPLVIVRIPGTIAGGVPGPGNSARQIPRVGQKYEEVYLYLASAEIRTNRSSP